LRRFQEDWDQPGSEDAQSTSPGWEEELSAVSTAQEEGSPLELTAPLPSARYLSYLLIKDPVHLEAKDQQLLTFSQQEKVALLNTQQPELFA
jgi:hypothetical protein